MGKFSKITTLHFWWKILPFVGWAVWGVLGFSRNLWYDEAYSAALVSNSWFDMLRITAADTHSPFYYALLKLCYHLAGGAAAAGGAGFWVLKQLSVLFMAGYLFLGKYYVRKLFDETISVYFMFASIAMPSMAVQAANVRMYALALFCMTLTGLAACDLYREPKRWKWLVFCTASVASVYCHTFSMIQTAFWYLLFLAVILLRKRYELLKGFLWNALVVSVSFSPWLVVTYIQLRLRMGDNPLGTASGVPTLYTFMDYCKEWFSALETPISLVVLLGMGLALLLGYCAIEQMRRRACYIPALGLTGAALTALTGTLLSLYVNPCFLGRYIFPGFGSLALLYAFGLKEIISPQLKSVTVALVLTCFLLQYRSEFLLEYDEGLKTYEEFYARNVTEQDGFLSPNQHSVFLSVYHPQIPHFLYAYKPGNLPFQNIAALLEWEQLDEIEGSLWFICLSGGTPKLLEPLYTYEKVLSFHYMYYDFVIYRCEKAF
ncbi:MAG: hypothetical protein LBQ15_10415 [Clostridium sp.]|jgi:hypothetical protein|nr:hypothetical protein [Clostridium sp.]